MTKLIKIATIFYWISLSLVIGSCGSGIEPVHEQLKEKSTINSATLFTRIPSSETGITFINELIETEQFNFTHYEYMYNGAGVGIGDINNDGLADIFFAGNLVSNRLYLNTGNMKFKDISETAGINITDGWCTGVSMADVNADGFLDIYVCRALSDDDAAGRGNLLFINNGDLTFSEKGEEYGVNDQGHSTQALFLDFDKDGYLDLYVANHPRKLLFDFEEKFAT